MALIALSGLGAFGIGILAGSRNASTASPPGWTTYSDPEVGFTVQFPSRWNRARERLVPNRFNPLFEILSVGTGPMKVGGGGNCGEYPVRAIAAMGPRDVLISIKEEVLDGTESWIRNVPQRPRHFRVILGSSATRMAEARTTVPGIGRVRNALSWTELEFRDRGRVLRVFLAIGEGAPPKARRAVLRTLDSLRFEPGGG